MEAENNLESKKRVEYLDIIKAISILLVVFCHTPLLNKNSVIGNIAMIICWGAVPCFFMTTGAIYLNKQWTFKKYIKKLVSIYVIICVWKIIYIYIYQSIGTINIFTTSKKLILSYIFLFDSLPGIVTGHFWFMYAYLTIFAIYPIFNLLFQKGKEYSKYLILIISILFICTALTWSINLIFEFFHIGGIKINNIRLVNPFGNYAHMLFYFLIGGCLYKYNLYDRFKTKKTLIKLGALILIIIGTLGLVFIKKYQSGTFEFQYIWLLNGYNWTSTIVLACGIFILFQGISIKSRILSKLLTEVGKNTMGIFYLHTLVLELLRVFKFDNRGNLINLLKSVIVILICYLIIVVIRKIPVVRKIIQ